MRSEVTLPKRMSVDLVEGMLLVIWARAMRRVLQKRSWMLGLLGATSCLDEAARVQHLPQFVEVEDPTSPTNSERVQLRARASSGLPVDFRTITPNRCTVDRSSGLVWASTPGACVVLVEQAGNDTFAAAEAVSVAIDFQPPSALHFAPPPVLGLFDFVTVRATAGATRALRYRSSTPATCHVDASSGLVEAIALGTCVVEATADGQVAQTTMLIEPPADPTQAALPTIPDGIDANVSEDGQAIEVRAATVRSGGLRIERFSVDSEPVGLRGEGRVFPLRVPCDGDCTGRSVRLRASHALGASLAVSTHVRTVYRVETVFYEPDTQPTNSTFLGTFTHDATSRMVTALEGALSEAMTGSGGKLEWLQLTHLLAADPLVVDGRDGWLLTVFRLPTTHTLSTDARFAGTDGFSPGSGGGLYYGYPGPNPGNAYVRIFVDAADPTRPLPPLALSQLAYADCTEAGMMGATCMTGTSLAGHGTVGTMGGTPLRQSISRLPHASQE